MNRRIALIIAFTACTLMGCCCGGFGQKAPPNKNVIAEEVKKADKAEVKEQPPTFLTPDKAALLGGFRVQLLSGGIGKVKYFDDIRRTTFDSKDERLWVKISVANTSETKLEQYHPWSGRDFSFDNDRASLKDEFGNNYFNIRGSGIGAKPLGQLERMTRLDPGKSIEDLIIFDRPIDKAAEFTLEFPGGNIGHQTDRIVYKVPRSFFEPK